ncbi:PhnD/SsuA/transferrin family substrate-binding protein [Sphingomonas sp. RP10(2022)]|uniref:PhnD/SsuA/transferrin family substrate-binding protein n=1 Tax=Sphingomonas liriopis TaxID=2949094 RepID=A0A9X2KR79_9SPHN|nr:PhnD/SsuA/transferrin family substrate-binding protein [Sphingomonas liriopis]MCP3735730.1 PhnD/SsuA/transferrin family substrate-binding protein [Sphingomonas liriopis]
MTAGIASLGMYDHPAQQAANDALWTALGEALRRRGVAAPERLDRTRPPEAIWRDPALLIAQACGYPLVTDPDLDLRVVAVPVYAVPGCAGARHFSHIVTRRDDGRRGIADYRGARAAINAATSNSGYNLFRAAIARCAGRTPMFAAVIDTGSHRGSVAAVAGGDVDIAAIDAVTWAAIARFEPEAVAGLRILAATDSSPTLPFVTSRHTSRTTLALLRAALDEVSTAPALAETRDTLFLERIVPASIHRFAALRGLERDAARAGYARLQ